MLGVRDLLAWTLLISVVGMWLVMPWRQELSQRWAPFGQARTAPEPGPGYLVASEPSHNRDLGLTVRNDACRRRRECEGSANSHRDLLPRILSARPLSAACPGRASRRGSP